MNDLKTQLTNDEQRLRSGTAAGLSGILPGDLGSPIVGTEYIVGRVPVNCVITGWTAYAEDLEDQSLPLPINSVTVDIGYVGAPTYWGADIVLANFIPVNGVLPMQDFTLNLADIVITVKTPGFEAEKAIIVFVPSYTELDTKKGCYTA